MAEAKKKTTAKNSKKTDTANKTNKRKSTGKKGASKTSAGRAKKGTQEHDVTLPKRRERASSEGYSPASEAGILILLAVCVLLFLSNFGVIGAVGNAAASFLFGLFGSAAYIFPFALFFSVVMLVANFANRESVVKTVMIWLSFLIIGMFFAMAWSGDFETRRSSFAGDPFFRYGMEQKKGGGLIPGHFYAFMSDALGSFGTIILMITVLIICIGMLT